MNGYGNRYCQFNVAGLVLVMLFLSIFSFTPIWTAPTSAGETDQDSAKPGGSMEAVTVGDLEISGLWLRPTPPAAPASAGYLVIRNKGTDTDRLVGASADFAARTEIHEMAMNGGVMKMRPVSGGMAIPPGGKVVLEPGGMHMMFMGLTGQLAPGEKRMVKLEFEKAGIIELLVPVTRTPGGKSGHLHN